MKKQFFVLSLMAWMSFSVVAQSDMNRSSCCKLKTCAPKTIAKPTTITNSGCYCLTDDICGQITIAADNVTLDLNCHEVNGNGADAAIKADGHYNVVVKNGTVSNFLVVKNRGIGIAPNRCGVAISNGTDIELHDLNVISTDPVGMALLNCIGLNISGCDFSNNNQALQLVGCRNGKVSCCQAYDNVNANFDLGASAVVSCEFCDCIEFVDVDVCNNRKNIEALGLTDPRSGVCTVAFSSNVSFERCKINSNSTDLPVTNIGSLLIIFSENCTATDCQANNNTAQDSSPFAISEGHFSFAASFSSECVIRNCQANGNSFTAQEEGAYRGIVMLGSVNGLIERCQVNNNSITGGTDSLMLAFATFDSDTVVVRGCQANGNSALITCIAFSFQDGSDFRVENCQANNNMAGIQAVGIIASIINCDIIGCQINNTNASTAALGISASESAGLMVEDCEINNTTSDGFAIGIFMQTGQRDVRIVNCVVHGTHATNSFAVGISLQDGTQNVVIKCCQVFDTVSSSPLPFAGAGGIGMQFTNDISIQDCQVYDTRGENSALALGIGSLTDTFRCNIEGCIANNTTAAANLGLGIGFLGLDDNNTVKDCSAIGNLFGFGDFSGNGNFFAGNYAENNAVADYAGVTAVPVMFDKSMGAFSATPNRWSNIVAMP